MAVPAAREAFDFPEGIAYLNTAYMGPLPRAAKAAAEAALEAKSQPWRIVAEDFFAPVARLRGLVAGFLDGDPDGVALVPSVSYGVATVAANLRTERRRVVVLEEQFPSNYYAWRRMAASRGGDLVVASPARVAEVIDDDTAVVAVESCHWTDGTPVDLVGVAEAARVHGAALVVDVTQSLGAVPFAHHLVRPDAVVGALYKWLLAPYGGAFLWVGAHLREGEPLELNWITRAGSEDFAGLVAYTDRFQPGARRYDNGEVSSHVNVAGAVASLQLVSDWGPAAVASHAASLSERLVEGARRLGLDVPTSRSPHLLGLRLGPEAPPPGEVARSLAAADVYVSIRGSAIRVSLHAFNTCDDVDRLLSALGHVLAHSQRLMAERAAK